MKFISSGSYGCVFHPSFKCDDRAPQATDVGKLFGVAKEARKEWIKTRVLHKMDPKGELFLYPEHMCSVPLETIIGNASSEEASRCDFLKGETEAIRYEQLIMKHGGVPFFEYISGIHNLNRADLVFIASNVFLGIKVLVENGYAHQDIRSDNIIASDRAVRLIDFGFLHNKRAFYTKTNFLLHEGIEYRVNPTEYRYVHTSLPLEKFAEQEYTLLSEELPRINRSVLSMEDFYNMRESFRGMRYPMAFLKKNNTHEKSDIFSLGLVLATACHEYCVHVTQDDPVVVELFDDMVRGMTKINVFERTDIRSLYRQHSKIKSYSAMNKTKPKVRTGKASRIACPPGKVRNPATGRCKKRAVRN